MIVRNFSDMDIAIANRADFQHRSYKGINTSNGYELSHWGTLIMVIDDNGESTYGDLTYYSQTTSEFQGRILREGLSEKGRDIVRELFKDEPTKVRNRIYKMMR